MPVLSTDMIDIKFSKDMPVQPLDAVEVSKAGENRGSNWGISSETLSWHLLWGAVQVQRQWWEAQVPVR